MRSNSSWCCDAVLLSAAVLSLVVSPRSVPADPPNAVTNAANACVAIYDNQGRMLGSGCVIARGNRPLILTCAHLFRKGTNGIQCTINGSAGIHDLVKPRVDKNDDLAVFAFERKVTINNIGVHPLAVAAKPPKAGSPIYCIGAVVNPNTEPPFTPLKDKIRGYFNKQREFTHKCETHYGHSGGPILTSDGRLCGIHVRYDGRTRRYTKGGCGDS